MSLRCAEETVRLVGELGCEFRERFAGVGAHTHDELSRRLGSEQMRDVELAYGRRAFEMCAKRACVGIRESACGTIREPTIVAGGEDFAALGWPGHVVAAAARAEDALRIAVRVAGQILLERAQPVAFTEAVGAGDRLRQQRAFSDMRRRLGNGCSRRLARDRRGSNR